MAVPYTFATATSSIPLSQLDANFATGITLGNTTVYLGNTTTSIGNLTLTNATISSVASTFPNSYLANSSVTIGSTNVSLGGTATTIAGLTLTSPTITGGTSTATQNLANVTGTLAVGNGGTGLTSFTANGVVYASSTSALATGSALTFDGTNFATTGSISTTIASKTAQFNAVGGSIYAQFADGTTTWRLGTGIQAAGQFNLYDVTNAQTALTFVPGASGYTAFLQNNSEQMRLTSTGLGIGTSSPSFPLQVQRSGDSRIAIVSTSGSNTAVTQYSTNNGSTYWYNYYNGSSFIFQDYAFERMRIDSSGNVGIGTTSPTTKLTVNGDVLVTGGGTFMLRDNTCYLYAPSSNNMTFITASTERARIDSSGNLLVGQTSPVASEKFGVTNAANGPAINGYNSNASLNSQVLNLIADRNTTNGTFFAIRYYNNGAAANKFYVQDGGQIYSTSTTITAISDETLKTNIKPLETGLNEILKLQPRRFDWIDESDKNVAGFIAQEVESILPDLVKDYAYSDTETKKALKMGDMIPTLVKAIQEQQTLINNLTTRLNALEGK